MEKSELIKLYKNKILGVRNYTSDQNEFKTEDFIVLDKLDRILSEIKTYESDITPAGKEFIKQYYDIEELSEILFYKTKNKYLVDELQPILPGDIKEWLLKIEPMIGITFIEKSRGNNTGEGSLRPELLPPGQLDILHFML